MSKQQRVKLAHAEAENKALRDELALVAWERDGARKREVILAIQCQSLRRQTEVLEQENAAKDRRTDDVREAWRFELRRADAAELRAAKAEADKAAAALIVAEAQQDADTAVELAQKALAALVAKDTRVVELEATVQRLEDQAVTADMEREFRP